MRAISLPGFIHAVPAKEYESKDADVVDGYKMKFSTWDDMTVCGFVSVGAGTLNFEIPDNWDPRPAQVAALTAEKARLKSELAAALARIDQQINSLLALEAA